MNYAGVSSFFGLGLEDGHVLILWLLIQKWHSDVLSHRLSGPGSATWRISYTHIEVSIHTCHTST